MINRNLGKKRLIWLTCPDPSPSLGAAKTAPGAEAMEASCFLPTARSTGFLIQPSTTSPGVSLPQWAAFSRTNQEIKKMPHRLSLMEAVPQLRFSIPRYIWVCAKLTKNNQHMNLIDIFLLSHCILMPRRSTRPSQATPPPSGISQKVCFQWPKQCSLCARG